MPAPKPKKPAGIIAEFNAVFEDRALTPRGRLARALELKSEGKRGASEVKRRQERIRQRLKRLEPQPPAPPAWAERVWSHDGQPVRRIVQEYLSGEGRGRTAFRAAVFGLQHPSPAERRTHLSGDDALANAFVYWFSKHRRPLLAYRTCIVYQENPKFRGPGVALLYHGFNACAGLLDIPALRRSGWTTESEPGFALDGIIWEDLLLHPWFGPYLSHLALTGQHNPYELQGTLSSEEQTRDIFFARSRARAASEGAAEDWTHLLPAGLRLFSMPVGGGAPPPAEATARKRLAAEVLGVRPSHVKRILVWSLQFTRPLHEPGPAPAGGEKEEYVVVVFMNGYKFDVGFSVSGGRLEAQTNRPAVFETYEEAEATLMMADLPEYWLGQSRFAVERRRRSFVAYLDRPTARP